MLARSTSRADACPVVSYHHRSTRGKKRKDTVLICLSSDEVDEGKIQMNKGESSRMMTDGVEGREVGGGSE